MACASPHVGQEEPTCLLAKAGVRQGVRSPLLVSAGLGAAATQPGEEAKRRQADRKGNEAAPPADDTGSARKSSRKL